MTTTPTPEPFSLLQTRVPDEVKEWIEAQAQPTGISTAMWLRQLLIGLYDAQGKKAKRFTLEIVFKAAAAAKPKAAAAPKRRAAKASA